MASLVGSTTASTTTTTTTASSVPLTSSALRAFLASTSVPTALPLLLPRIFPFDASIPTEVYWLLLPLFISHSVPFPSTVYASLNCTHYLSPSTYAAPSVRKLSPRHLRAYDSCLSPALRSALLRWLPEWFESIRYSVWPEPSPYASALYPVSVMEGKSVMAAFIRR